MLVATAVVFTILRPGAVRRVLPLLLPLAVVIQLALPGTFSTVTALFLPKGLWGLVNERVHAQLLPVGYRLVRRRGPGS